MFRNITILLLPSFFLSSCAGYVVNTGTKAQVDPNSTVECNTSIYGDACNNLEDFILVKKDELDALGIKKGVKIADIEGTAEGVLACSEDGEIGCVSTSEYKAININNHKSKIISSENINGVSGEFVVPTPSTVVSTSSYGVSGSIVGTIPNCTSSSSGCYIKSYTQGIAGSQFKALDYDDIDSKKSNIQNGYELISGITGTQTLCTAGDNSCYVDNNNFKAIDSSVLVSSNIKNAVSLGGVTGNYTGDYSDCTSESHTGCLATSSYPSVPSSLTSSLLASASINNVSGSIGNCTAGGSSCYVNGSFKAAEASLLIASNIKSGVSIGGVSGEYPSTLYPLIGASNTTDLVSSNFNSLMVGSNSFEWFDSKGNRYTGTGDLDLVATNIKRGNNIFGVFGTYAPLNNMGVGNLYALAFKKKDGSVVSVGNSRYGGDFTYSSEGSVTAAPVGSLSSGVVNIFSTSKAFAALKSDGSVVTWGDSELGGDSSSAVGGTLSSEVVNIYSNNGAFVALKSNGSVVTWGDKSYGGDSSFSGDIDYRTVIAAPAGSLLSGVVSIYSNTSAFAALKSDGSVVTWGMYNSSYVNQQLRSGVIDIVPCSRNFAALKSDGSVVSWGEDSYYYEAIRSSLVDVIKVFSGGACAALKSDGSVVTWGNRTSGGDFTYSYVGEGPWDPSVSAAPVGSLSSGVINIFSNGSAFAALKSNGSVVTWGNSYDGGDSSSPVGGSLSSGVINIFSNGESFAALKSDGSVVTWGNSEFGGDSSSVSSSLSSEVTKIFSTYGAFAALKSDGSVVTWGNSVGGGSTSNIITYTGSSSVSDIVNIFSTGSMFMAIREDESYVVWGCQDDW